MDFATAWKQSGGPRVKNMVKVADRLAFQGGLNLMDSPSLLDPGQLLGVQNMEPGIRGGYRKVDGYERFDGHTSPSDGTFVTLGVNAGYAPSIGSTITEGTSGATGVVAYVDNVNNNVVVVNTTGTFHGLGYTLTGGGTTVGPPYVNSANTNALANSYYYQKWLYLQSLIGAVPGSGSILGVWPYLGAIYAFRNNVGGTAAQMWKSTSSGWTQVQLGLKVYYNTGVYSNSMQPPAEGTVLTGATSGATFTVLRVITKTGTWGGDAAGFFVVSSITGTPTANEQLKAGATVVANYVSNAAQTINPGGTYFFRNHNFNTAQNPASGFRMYGVNGVSNGFEYDSVANVFVNIETGMSPDFPDHLEVHADYLFYGFGGSLQNSGYQKPLNWQVVFGADSRSVGEPITFMREDVSQTLIIGTRRRIWTLTGISTELFQIRVYAANTGAIQNTDETPGQMIFMEDRGITTLAAAGQYGNFEAASLTDKILRLMTNLNAVDTPIGATVTRKKNMYRLMFASGTVLSLGINAQGQFTGWCTSFMLDKPSCFYSGFYQLPGQPQIERGFFGGTSGYVFEIDKGRSFDGKNIQWFGRIAYYDSKSPDTYKRYRRCQVDIAPEGQVNVSMSVDYDFGQRSGQQGNALPFMGNGGFWDISTWDQFVWSAPIYSQAILKIEGEGFNIGLFFAGNANNDSSVTLYSCSLQYSSRIINRNTKDA